MEPLYPRPIDGLAIFPLGQVLLPATGMGLVVFEPRYRQMVVDCLATDHVPPEFGTVLIERGREVGGGDERSDVGVLSHMQGLEAHPDGRYTFIAVGVRRIRIVEWLSEDPYPRALTEDWPDDDGDDPTLSLLLDAARRRAHALRKMMREAGVGSGEQQLVTDDTPGVGCFQLAAQLPIGPADRSALLKAPTVRERFTQFDAVLDDVESMLRFGMT